MKKLAFAFSALILILTSCSSSNDEGSTSTDTNSILPKKITYIENGTTEINTITYNGNKIVSLTSSLGTSAIYTYTGNQISQIDEYTGTHLDNRKTYSYNSNGKLATYIGLSYNSTNPSGGGNKLIFTYNNDGTVSYISYGGNLVTQTTLITTGTLYYTNGEVTKIDYVYQGSTTHTLRNYTYDDKNNPLKNITGFAETSFFNDPSGYFHNVLSVQDGSSPNPSTNTYTYNSNNFPTEAVGHSSSGTTTYTTQYVY